jgi:hypothetical protein
MSQSTPFHAECSTALTDQNTLEFTVQVLMQHFEVQATGYCCHTRDLWQVLVAAAAHGSTIEATCNDLKAAPDSNTIRAYLNNQLTIAQVRPVETNFNRALASQLPRWFRRQLRHKEVQLALDLHDVPYYGRTDQRNPADHWVCRGEAQAGTTRFYRCATAYVMQRDVRWSLAVTFVQPRDSQVSIVQRLIEHMRTLGLRRLRRGCLYLDKAFCSVPVLRYLQEKTSFVAIVAAPLRGKAGSGGGTRALCQGRASYFTHHTFRSPEHGALQVPLAVVRTWCRRRDGTCVPTTGRHLPGTVVGVCGAAAQTTEVACHSSASALSLALWYRKQPPNGHPSVGASAGAHHFAQRSLALLLHRLGAAGALWAGAACGLLCTGNICKCAVLARAVSHESTSRWSVWPTFCAVL